MFAPCNKKTAFALFIITANNSFLPLELEKEEEISHEKQLVGYGKE